MLILLAILTVGFTFNRVAHHAEFQHKNQEWVLKNFPGSKPLTPEEIWRNCLDGSPACEISPELEKEHRKAARRPE